MKLLIYIFLLLQGILVANDKYRINHVISHNAITTQTKEFKVLIQINVDPAWYLYSIRSSGDFFPPELKDFSLPFGVGVNSILHSNPIRYKDNLFIYKNKAFILVNFTINENAILDKQKLKFILSFQLCTDDSCLPPEDTNIDIVLNLDSKEQLNSKYLNLIKQFPKNILDQDKFKLKTNIKDNVLGIELDSLKNDVIKDVLFVPTNKDIILNKNKWQKINEHSLENSYKINSVIKEISGHLTISTKDGDYQYYIDALKVKNKVNFMSYIYYIIIAFIGGVIINFMPCVFPVIALKVLSIVDDKKEDRVLILKKSLYFSFGIISSLMILATFIIVLKNISASFANITWGFQLQEPIFIFFLAIIFISISLNLFGVFEIGIFFTRYSSKNKSNNAFIKSFTNGIITTLSSTPCLAPFFTTAITFAFNSNAFVSLLIFFTIGLGMSAPYFLLSMYPKALALLPKPGAWMNYFKGFLGFMMLFVVFWLISVLNEQIDSSFDNILYSVGVFCIGLWLYGLSHHLLNKKVKKIFMLLFLICIIYPCYYSVKLIQNEQKENSFSTSQKKELALANKKIYWEDFSMSRFEQLQQEGKNFFIDFTATWCLTCISNKKLVLNRQEIFELFKEKNITAIRADFTKYNEDIAVLIKRFNSIGIPLYIIYNKESKEFVKLNNILTISHVKEEIDKLSE